MFVLVQQECCMGTKLYIKGKPAPDKWTFQETMLNQQVSLHYYLEKLACFYEE
jgi:hypothetical protein